MICSMAEPLAEHVLDPHRSTCVVGVVRRASSASSAEPDLELAPSPSAPARPRRTRRSPTGSSWVRRPVRAAAGSRGRVRPTAAGRPGPTATAAGTGRRRRPSRPRAAAGDPGASPRRRPPRRRAAAPPVPAAHGAHRNGMCAGPGVAWPPVAALGWRHDRRPARPAPRAPRRRGRGLRLPRLLLRLRRVPLPAGVRRDRGAPRARRRSRRGWAATSRSRRPAATGPWRPSGRRTASTWGCATRGCRHRRGGRPC